jgi:hypothetical protein
MEKKQRTDEHSSLRTPVGANVEQQKAEVKTWDSGSELLPFSVRMFFGSLFLSFGRSV